MSKLSKQISRNIGTIVVLLAMAAPVACVAQTGTDPEPTSPNVVIQIILTVFGFA